MPTYTFTCRRCGETFTMQRTMDQRDAPVNCVTCGADAQRQPDAPAFTVAGGTPTHYPR